jgi:hypothetical protein
MVKYSFSCKTTAIIGFLILTSFTSTIMLSAQAQTSGGAWQVNVNGLVQNPLSLSISDLQAMPQTSVVATIYCVDFPNSPVTSGKWTGVALSTILGQAGVQSSVVKIAFYAADGYSTDLDLLTAMRSDIILAYEKDGAPLSETLRLVVPGKWGYKWINQVTAITLVDYDYKGKWESQGYTDEANVQEGASSPPSYQAPPTVPSYTQPATANVTSPTPQTSNMTSTVPTQNTDSSTPKIDAQTPTPFPTTWAAIAVTAVIAATLLLVYAKKRRSKQGI